jgi:hypothetical protein
MFGDTPLDEVDTLRGWIRRPVSQRCPGFVSHCVTKAVLFVGAERRDEFADAMRLAYKGHDVTLINHRETAAERKFRPSAGTGFRLIFERWL